MTQHNTLTTSDNHNPYSYSYADETARLAATGFTADDVPKIAYQESDNTTWTLTDHSPITWVQIGGGVITDYFNATNSASFNIASGGTPTALVLDTEPFSEAAYNTGTGQYTVPSNGVYEFWADLQCIFTEATTGYCYIAVLPATVICISETVIHVSTVAQHIACYSGPITLAQNDVLSATAVWPGSVSQATAFGAAGNCRFTGRKLV